MILHEFDNNHIDAQLNKHGFREFNIVLRIGGNIFKRYLGVKIKWVFKQLFECELCL